MTNIMKQNQFKFKKFNNKSLIYIKTGVFNNINQKLIIYKIFNNKKTMKMNQN